MKTLNKWMLDLLTCPFCKEDLSLSENKKSLACTNRHNFDLSAKGYVTLLTSEGSSKKWDTADMVARRVRFHEQENYSELKVRLAELLTEFVESKRTKEKASTEVGDASATETEREQVQDKLTLLDVGSGPGYYSYVAAECGYQALACDLSRKALQHAVKLHEDIEGIACDVWSGMPFKDASFDVILSIFAPKNPLEFKRTLKPGGILIVVTPNKDHYAKMRERFPLLKIGRQGKTKEDELREALEPHFTLLSREDLRPKALLDAQYIEDLIMMGPNAYHTNFSELQDMLATLEEPIEDVGSLAISVYSV